MCGRQQGGGVGGSEWWLSSDMIENPSSTTKIVQYLHVLLPFQGGIFRVNSVLCSVRTCRRLVQRTVLLELLRDFGHQSVVGVGICYQLTEILKKSVP